MAFPIITEILVMHIPSVTMKVGGKRLGHLLLATSAAGHLPTQLPIIIIQNF